MLRVILKTVATGALAVSALALAAEGSPTKSTRPTVDSDAAGFFTRIYGSHPECRYGEYREDGKRREGWHQHLRGQVFRCTPGSTDGPGTPKRSSPGDSGRGSYGDRGRATGNRSDGGGSSNIKRRGTSNGDRGITLWWYGKQAREDERPTVARTERPNQVQTNVQTNVQTTVEAAAPALSQLIAIVAHGIRSYPSMQAANMIRVLLWGLAAIVLQAGAAAAQERPVLMLDNGGHMGLVSGVVFTPDGKYLVSTGYDKVIRVWDWQAGQVVRVLRGQVGAGDEGRINTVAISPDGRRLAAGGQMALRGQSAQPIRIYDFETGELVQLLTGHTGKIIALAFSPDGMRILSGSGDRTAVLWDVTTGRLLHRLDRHKAEVYGVAFTPDGARVVTGSFDRMIRLWRSADGGLIAELNALKDYALAVSRKDGTIASGSLDGEIRLWDSGTGRHISTFKQGRTVVGSLNFSPDGRWLLSTCGGGNSCDVDAQYIWDITNGTVVQAYRGHDNSVLAAAISPDGRLVATGGGDRARDTHLGPTDGPK